jgi:AhpD family alkylhydroperoxidase
MKAFNRRLYRSFSDLLFDVRAVMSKRESIRAMMHSTTLTPAFRERLFLAVTQVNGCRYCSYFHAQQALTHGISEEEIRAIGDGLLDHCPQEELVGVCYAQHWAETDADPAPEARARLLETYGEETTAQIELALRMIRVGNLTGNLFDYILYRLSFGRIDINKPPRIGKRASHQEL